jgi:hypothetical protein
MATSTSVDKAVDDLLTCTICLETFKVPKYLPCLHTFCKTCIHTHITSFKRSMIIFTCFAVRLLTYNAPWNCFIRFTVPFTWVAKFLRFNDSVSIQQRMNKVINSKPCCTVCATVHHRKCEHVVTIAKAVYGVKESSKAIELLTKL